MKLEGDFPDYREMLLLRRVARFQVALGEAEPEQTLRASPSQLPRGSGACVCAIRIQE